MGTFVIVTRAEMRQKVYTEWAGNGRELGTML